MGILYKILPATEWVSASAAGSFNGSAIDISDGFIHLSAAHQVRETAGRHFAGQERLVLVAFDAATLQELKWETSRGGALFPHVYGAIPVNLALWVKELPLEQGRHHFPEGIPA